MGHAPDDHDCEWRARATELERELADTRRTLGAELDDTKQKFEAVVAAMQALERRVLGPKAEKMPTVTSTLKHERSEEEIEAAREAALARRRERQAQREKLRKETIIRHVTDEEKHCPRCGGTQFAPLGDGRKTTVYEYVPGYFVRQEYVQEKLACRCGGHIVQAPPPPKPIEKGRYGPGFLAHLVTMKCGDSIPIHRLAKQYERLGIPMSRSTMNDLFHASAASLAPLADRLVQLVAGADVVQADETSMKMQREDKRGFVWAFLAGNLIAYRFAADRSGKTPAEVLGGTKGALVVDAYTGYNRVTDVDGRERAGCIAHARRKFFEALVMAPGPAKTAMDFILDTYRVEHEALARGIVRTPAHLALRRERSRPVMDRFHDWLVAEQGLHPPRSAIGVAIGYALNQWQPLTRFLENECLPVDNNASERALRVVALGRKNFLFVGHEEAGANLAGLYSLVATCDANGVEPVEYLTDVLMRVQTHPAAKIDELLPHRWTRQTGPVE
jgi:transposase